MRGKASVRRQTAGVPKEDEEVEGKKKVVLDKDAEKLSQLKREKKKKRGEAFWLFSSSSFAPLVRSPVSSCTTPFLVRRTNC